MAKVVILMVKLDKARLEQVSSCFKLPFEPRPPFGDRPKEMYFKRPTTKGLSAEGRDQEIRESVC